MKGFSTRNGDVVIGKMIELVEDDELLRQKVSLVLSTNRGEWAYDTDEGISFPLLFRKNPDEGEIMETIEEALKKIDESFVLTEFSLTMKGRAATINFKAVNNDGVEVGGANTYGD